MAPASSLNFSEIKSAVRKLQTQQTFKPNIFNSILFDCNADTTVLAQTDAVSVKKKTFGFCLVNMR